MTETVVAAGAVVSRRGPEILLVHRPKYDDWSFPKGKVDPGEHIATTAVREVAEETGLDVRLGPPLSNQHYVVHNGNDHDKRVHYWSARVVGDDDVSTYRPNEEIDDVAWVPLESVCDQLTYERDRATLEEFVKVPRKTRPLVILRHAKAKSRKDWTKDDRKRPLTKTGHLQADQLVPVLGAYGITRVLSSSSRRCWTTIGPYSDVAELDLEVTRDLSEEDATPRAVARHVNRLLDRPDPAVLCTHRPVLPLVYDALGIGDPHLKAGAMLVLHHRDGQIAAVEHHAV